MGNCWHHEMRHSSEHNTILCPSGTSFSASLSWKTSKTSLFEIVFLLIFSMRPASDLLAWWKYLEFLLVSGQSWIALYTQQKAIQIPQSGKSE